MLPSVLFKKRTELEKEPNALTSNEIASDLSVDENDPLYSDSVERILSTHDKRGEKSETLNTKSFRTIEKILQVKEDLLSQQKQLEEKLQDLSNLGGMLISSQQSISDNIEELEESSRDNDSRVFEKEFLNK